MADYVIGIDCGGTHTEGYAYNQKGKEEYHFHGGQANLMANANQAFENVSLILSQFFKSLNRKECKLILIGFAGLGVYGQQDKIIKKLGLEDMNVRLVSDADIALINVLRGQDGLLVIAGTGTVVLGQQGLQKIRIGGWGHLLGDAGGGYFLGRSAYKKVTDDYDEGQYTDFSNEFMKHLGVSNVFSAVNDFYSKSKSEVGQQALFVAARSDQLDEDAQLLIRNAATALSRQVILGISRLNIKGSVTIGLSGSLVEHNALYEETLRARVQRKCDNVLYTKAIKNQNNAKAAFYAYQSWQ